MSSLVICFFFSFQLAKFKTLIIIVRVVLGPPGARPHFLMNDWPFGPEPRFVALVKPTNIRGTEQVRR